MSGPPTLIREDGMNHRKGGDPVVKHCSQHETPKPMWDSKQKTSHKESTTDGGKKKEDSSMTDGEKKKGMFSVIKEFLTGKGVDDVLSSEDSR